MDNQALVSQGEKELAAIENGMRAVLILQLQAGGAPFSSAECNEDFHARVQRFAGIYFDLMDWHPGMKRCIERGDFEVQFGSDK